MSKTLQLLQYVTKSKFVRSILFQVVSVFLVVILLLVAIVSYSFGTEINKGLLADQKKQLEVVEDAVSDRMEEVISIAYNIGQDSTFYINPVAGIKYSGYEMSNTLARYLVGNRFIEYLAYYRLSEPDRIYTSCGELTFHRFWDAYLNCDNFTEESYLETIKTNAGVRLIPLTAGGSITFFTYVCPLPQFSITPQAFVIALIPLKEISALLSAQLVNGAGEVALYDAGGNLIYQVSTLAEDVPTQPHADRTAEVQSYLTANGSRYAEQAMVSDVNGWIYISVIRLNSVLAGLNSAQLVAILAVVALMIVAVLIILIGIIRKYKPISNLAQTLTNPAAMDDPGGIIDEKTLLSSTIETLKSDSEQKRALEAAYHEATLASKAKSTFLSNMSHDIRTPMNAIIGMTGIALKHVNDAAYVRDCLGKVQVASRYLLDIINNVLDMSRIESGKVTLTEEVIDLPEFIHGIITIIHTNIKEKHQRLVVEAEHIRNETFMGDNVRLTQVCMNILSNAMKFTPEGGEISMRVSQAEDAQPGKGNYTFVFSDTGIGMSEEFVKKVFDTFSRAQDTGGAKVEGTGLGMAIAKNLVELMGGTIACESEPGKGTTFTVKLSMNTTEDELPLEFTTRIDFFRDMPTLILGGDGETRARQAELFTDLGLKADCAASVPEAVERMRQARQRRAAYRFVLINAWEGDPNGAAAVAELSAAAPAADVLYVLAASDFMEVDKAEAVKAGISRFVRAPLFRSSVLSMLENADTPEKAHGAAEDGVVNLTGKRVLLVEDNAINREIARKLIGETKAEVVEAVNGKDAVDAFASRPEGAFDLILMDVQMPVMDGMEAAATIRAMARADAATVPIYAMTANTFDEDVRDVMNAGMNGHLGKPYTPEELYRVLKEGMSTGPASGKRDEPRGGNA